MKLMRHMQIMRILNFIISVGSVVGIMQGVVHHIQGLPGSPFIRSTFPYSLVSVCMILKYIILNDCSQWVETNFSYIISTAIMIIQNEE